MFLEITIIRGDPNENGLIAGTENPQPEDLVAFLGARIVWDI